MSDSVINIQKGKLDEALTFIRRAACDATITDSVSIKNRALEDLTPEEATALLKENGFTVAPGKKIKFVVDSEDVMHVRIPYFGRIGKYPADETDPADGTEPGPSGTQLPDKMANYTYLIPELGEIYKEAYSGSSYGGGADEVVKFNNARLTDYAMSQCR